MKRKQPKTRWIVSFIPILFLATLVLWNPEDRATLKHRLQLLLPNTTPSTAVEEQDAQARYTTWSEVSTFSRNLFKAIVYDYDDELARSEREAIIKELFEAIQTTCEKYKEEQLVVLAVASQVCTVAEIPVEFQKDERGNLIQLTLKEDFDEPYVRQRYEELIIDWKSMESEAGKDSIYEVLQQTTRAFSEKYDNSNGQSFRLRRQLMRQHGLWMEAESQKDGSIRYVIKGE